MTHQATRRSFLRAAVLGITASFAVPGFAADKKQPNIVVISMNDSGFADFSPFGNNAYPAPNISKLVAAECRSAKLHNSQAICSTSLHALLTAYYPEESKPFNENAPLTCAMDTQYPAIAQLLKPQGYTSATFGKGYTAHAVDFIKHHQKRPFFLYVPHSMPHEPLSVSEEFANKSGEGLYADAMMELDWSVGQLMGALRESGVKDNTLVLFTSNNSPWIRRT